MKKRIRIIEYNILNGFYDETEDNVYKFNEERAKAAIEVIKKFNPDILILCESSFSPAHEKKAKKLGINVNDYAKLFGYKNSFYGRRTNKDGSTILTNYSLAGEDYSLETVSFVRTKLKIGKKEITLDVVHPHPTRLNNNEKRNFLKGVLRDMKKPYILAGDFNSVSPEDEYDFDKLVRGFSLIVDKEESLDTVKDILEAKTISYVLSRGLIDSYKKINKKTDYTNPTNLFKKYKDASMRIDYIFCSKDFKVIDSGIIKNELTEKASDHYPIYAILEI